MNIQVDISESLFQTFIQYFSNIIEWNRLEKPEFQKFALQDIQFKKNLLKIMRTVLPIIDLFRCFKRHIQVRKAIGRIRPKSILFLYQNLKILINHSIIFMLIIFLNVCRYWIIKFSKDVIKVSWYIQIIIPLKIADNGH